MNESERAPVVTLRCWHCDDVVCVTTLSDKCQRCGAAVAEQLDLGAIDCASGIVAGDLNCSKCRYNLRELKWNGMCPECAQPVLRSLDPDGSRKPCNLVSSGVFALIGLFLPIVSMFLFVMSGGGPCGPNVPGFVLVVLFMVLPAASFLVGLYLACREKNPFTVAINAIGLGLLIALLKTVISQ